MTIKIVHHDRNDHITGYFFRFDAVILLLEKVMGLQSCQKQGPKFVSTKEHTSRHGKWFNMTAVIILAMPVTGFEYGSLYLKLLSN